MRTFLSFLTRRESEEDIVWYHYLDPLCDAGLFVYGIR